MQQLQKDLALLKEVESKVESFISQFRQLQDEIAKVIVGQNEIVEGVILGLLVGGHLLLEGVPGLGKTKLVKTLSQCLSLKFSRIQFTPDLMPADITGTTVVHEHDSKRYLKFQPGPLFASIVLVDEINRCSPKTQSALLEAMQEGCVTVGKVTRPLPQPFYVLATQNPLEMEGTYPLPEAQLDRFLLKLTLGFPDHESVHRILDRTTQLDEPRPNQVMGVEDVLAMRSLAREVAVSREVQDYGVRIMFTTHPNQAASLPTVKRYVRYGSSPRGAQAMLLCAKVKALLDGRFAVSRKDIRAVAPAALRHRIILNFRGNAENVEADSVIQAVLDSLEGGE